MKRSQCLNDCIEHGPMPTHIQLCIYEKYTFIGLRLWGIEIDTAVSLS